MAKKSVLKPDPQEATRLAHARVLQSKKKRGVEAALAAAENADDDTTLKRVVKAKRAFKWPTDKRDALGRVVMRVYAPGQKFECTAAELRANPVIRECTVPDMDAVEAEAVAAADAAFRRSQRDDSEEDGATE